MSNDSPLRDRDFRSVLIVVFVVMLGFGIVAPVLPIYARSFDVSRSAVGLLISGFAFVRLLSQAPGGSLVDRFGERPVAVVGVWIVGLSSFGAAVAPNFAILLIARCLGGVGSAWFISSMYSYVLGLVGTERTGRALALYQGAFTLGISLGPAAGGILGDRYGLEAPFVVYGLACLASGMIAVVRLKPRDQLAVTDKPTSESDESVITLLREPTYMLAVFGNVALWVLLIGSRVTLIPLFASEKLGQSESWVGTLVTASAVAALVVLPVAGRLTDRNRVKTLAAGMTLSAVIVAVMGSMSSPEVVIGLAVLSGMTIGVGQLPVTALVSGIDASKRGRAVSIQQMFGDAGGIAGPLLAGFFADQFGFGIAFVATAVPALMVGLLAFGVKRR